MNNVIIIELMSVSFRYMYHYLISAILFKPFVGYSV
jgi:hypothetical protein